MNDIYAYFDYHGTLKERVSAPIRANSAQVNSIYAYWDNQSVEPVTYSVTWRLVGSDSFETTSEHYAETLAIPANYLGRRDLVFFKEAKLYNFIRFPVPSAVTAVAGTYVATIRYALSTQATFVLGSLTFEVEGDRGIVLGESLTLDQYNYLLERYSELYDWATLRFLPLTGGTITGDLEVTNTIRANGNLAAKGYRLSSPDEEIIKLDNSVGDTGELQFGIPSGDYSPAFYGSLGVKMWDGREKVYPYVKFNYYDANDEYETTDYEMIATQQWSNAMYLKLTGGTITGHTAFNSSATFNGPVTIYSPLTVQANMTFGGFEGHGGDEYHSGNVVFLNNITITADSPTQPYHATRKDYVDNLIASVKSNAFQVVQSLPQTGEEGIIYLVPVSGTDYYTQYIWEGNDWLDIGDTDIDLSGYLPVTGGTITGDLAIDGSVTIDGKDLQTELSEKADKTGYYGTLGAGYADVAKSIQTSVGRADETPFAFQTTGGSADVDTGIQQLRKLVGVSVIRNQKIQNGNFANASFWAVRGGTASVSSNELTLTITDHGSANRLQQDNNTPIANHIYLFYFYIKSSTASVGFIDYGNTYAAAGNFSIGTSYSLIIKILQPTAGTDVFRIYVNNNDGYLTNGDTVSFKDVRVIDLTQRYGSNTVVNAIIGNDSSTQVKKLLQFDPSILKQTAYDAGTLSSSQSAKLKSVGYNQFDGEWEYGGINNSTGVVAHNPNPTNAVHTKNFIRVQGGMEYTITESVFVRTTYWDFRGVYQYDINKNFISMTNKSSTNNDITLAPNCAYILVGWANPTTITMPADPQICVHLTRDGSRTGYEPYESQTYDLPNIVQRGILKVDASGNVYANGDVAYPDGTGETRFTLINLGNLNWQKGDAKSQRFYAPVSTLAGWVNDASTADINAIVSTGRYQAVILDNLNPTYHDNRFSIYTNHYIYILDKEKYASMTAAEFKSAMNGIYLCAKLATPTPITFDAFPENVWADDFGTTQFLDADGNEIVGLQGADFFYQANIAGFAESVYAKTGGDPEKIVYEDEVYAKAQADARFALKEALGGTLRQVLAMKANIDFGNTNYVDLGDFAWVYINERFVSPAGTVPNALNTSKNAVCTSYGLSPNWYNSGMPDKTVFFADDGMVVVHDSAYTDPTAFQNAMKGVLLAYEKAS